MTKQRIDFQPVGRTISVDKDTSILEASRSAGVGLSAICGGETGCGSCRVRLSREAAVSPANALECDTLTSDELENGYRLACQATVLGDLSVDIPPESLTAAQRTQVEGDEHSFELVPPVISYTLDLVKADREDLQSDWERLNEALIASGMSKPEPGQLCMIQQLPAILRNNGWRVQVGLRGDTIVTISAPEIPLLGLAVDIGTTKVAGYLMDMKTGKALAMQGEMNPQIAYGEDIMARITYLMKQTSGQNELQQAILTTLNRMVSELCQSASDKNDEGAAPQIYTPQQVVEIVVVGNTAMHHVFLGLPVSYLGVAPYIAAASASMDIPARELGLEVSPGAMVHLLPNIAGFIGGDHVSMLLATEVNSKSGNSIFLDIGTNTEVTLATKGRKISCSTASGPAFEGAHIRDGMRAADGAIERVRIIDNRVEYQTISEEKPVGICGSGILDAIAQFKEAGILNFRGGFETDHPLVRKGENGLEVVIASGDSTRHGHDIVLTRKDVSEIQLAKGAIRAGIELLLKEAGISADELDQVIIAGAFGSFIDINSAMTIGMFPSLPPDRFRQVGNAAGVGAKQALLSTVKRTEASEIAQSVEYLELAHHPDFTNEFAAAMRF